MDQITPELLLAIGLFLGPRDWASFAMASKYHTMALLDSSAGTTAFVNSLWKIQLERDDYGNIALPSMFPPQLEIKALGVKTKVELQFYRAFYYSYYCVHNEITRIYWEEGVAIGQSLMVKFVLKRFFSIFRSKVIAMVDMHRCMNAVSQDTQTMLDAAEGLCAACLRGNNCEIRRRYWDDRLRQSHRKLNQPLTIFTGDDMWIDISICLPQAGGGLLELPPRSQFFQTEEQPIKVENESCVYDGSNDELNDDMIKEINEYKSNNYESDDYDSDFDDYDSDDYEGAEWLISSTQELFLGNIMGLVPGAYPEFLSDEEEEEEDL